MEANVCFRNRCSYASELLAVNANPICGRCDLQPDESIIVSYLRGSREFAFKCISMRFLSYFAFFE